MNLQPELNKHPQCKYEPRPLSSTKVATKRYTSPWSPQSLRDSPQSNSYIPMSPKRYYSFIDLSPKVAYCGSQDQNVNELLKIYY